MKLSIEFIPSIFSGNSVRSAFPTHVWVAVRKQELARARNKCEICGSYRKLNCHEVWDYDLSKRIRYLKKFQIICIFCHHVKHFDMMHDSISRSELFHHFFKVNQCTMKDYDEEVLRANKLQVDVCSVKGKWKTHYGNFLKKKTGLFYCKRCGVGYPEQVLKCKKCGRGKFFWMNWDDGAKEINSNSHRVSGGTIPNFAHFACYTDKEGVAWHVPLKSSFHFSKNRVYKCDVCSKRIKKYSAFRSCLNKNHNILVREEDEAITMEELGKQVVISEAKQKAFLKALSPRAKQRLNVLMNRIDEMDSAR